jgi:hypothetical protein
LGDRHRCLVHVPSASSRSTPTPAHIGRNRLSFTTGGRSQCLGLGVEMPERRAAHQALARRRVEY